MNTDYDGNIQKVYDAMRELGFDEVFSSIVAKEMRTDYLSKRMAGYLKAAHPRSMEEVADEMEAIKSDRDRFKEKIENRKYIW